MPASEHAFLYIIGLGNPGEEYERTYHNVGFLALDSFAREGGPKWKKSSSGRFEYRADGPYTFIRPLTYMNLSGDAVAECIRYFDTDKASLLVIHDDIDLPLGSYRFSRDRGSAGHRGVASIIAALGDAEFARLRIGIDPSAERDGKKVKADDLVLKRIPEEHLNALQETFREIERAYLPLL